MHLHNPDACFGNSGNTRVPTHQHQELACPELLQHPSADYPDWAWTKPPVYCFEEPTMPNLIQIALPQPEQMPHGNFLLNQMILLLHQEELLRGSVNRPEPLLP